MKQSEQIPVVVRSAVPLDTKTQDAIKAQIRNLEKNSAAITFLVDAALVGGIKITIGDWKFDGSFHVQLAEMQRRITQ